MFQMLTRINRKKFFLLTLIFVFSFLSRYVPEVVRPFSDSSFNLNSKRFTMYKG